VKPTSPEQIPLPTALSRDLARRVLGLGVGIVVAMAPFLGYVKVPGFEALFNLLPFQIQSEIVALSAFIVSLITVALQFYVAEKISRRVLRRIFKRVLFAVLIGFVGFIVLLSALTERVPRGHKKVSVMISFSRTTDCICKTSNNIECIRELSFNEAAIQSCWGTGPLKVIKVLFILWYLALMSGFVVLVGLDLLRRAPESPSRQPPPKQKTAKPSVRESAVTSADTGPAEGPPEVPFRKTPRTVGEAPPPEAAAAELVAQRELERKRAEGVFDVFLCHNSADKPDVKKIGKQLMERGILPWLDEWELPPGQPWQPLLERQIANIKSAAVFVGSAGVGPWQEQELRGFLSEFVSRQSPVIPVLLRNAPDKPELPLFLRAMTWVDFRIQDSNPLDRLIWGITGKRPERLSD
jgi:TIR domain-containing protein